MHNIIYSNIEKENIIQRLYNSLKYFTAWMKRKSLLDYRWFSCLSSISTVSCLFAHLFFSIQIQGIPCKVFVSTTMMTLTYWKYWIFINITSNASNIVSTDNTKRSQARASKISTKIDTEVRQIRTNGTHIDYKPYHHNSRQCYRLFVITGEQNLPILCECQREKE